MQKKSSSLFEDEPNINIQLGQYLEYFGILAKSPPSHLADTDIDPDLDRSEWDNVQLTAQNQIHFCEKFSSFLSLTFNTIYCRLFHYDIYYVFLRKVHSKFNKSHFNSYVNCHET